MRERCLADRQPASFVVALDDPVPAVAEGKPGVSCRYRECMVVSRVAGVVWLSAAVIVAFAMALAISMTAHASATGCSTDSNGQVVCVVPTGVPGVTATDHSTGLPHADGYQDVDVINLVHPCQIVRLYYDFALQGGFHVLPPVTVAIRQAAITDSGPWTVHTPSWLTQKIRALLRRDGLPGQAPVNYSLPYPNAYWYVFVAHTEAEALARGGVRCIR
jgi:hypothetical protein